MNNGNQAMRVNTETKLQPQQGLSFSTSISLSPGYILNDWQRQGNDYCVVMYSGKMGYVAKNSLVPYDEYKQKDQYPVGSKVEREMNLEIHNIYVVDSGYALGVFARERPDKSAKELFILGPNDPVLILETHEWYYKVMLPGPTTGFVYRNFGSRVEWAQKSESHFGYYGIRHDRVKSVFVRVAPNLAAEHVLELDASFRLPVVEEWDHWFKVQLPDGRLGFVPEDYGIRTITADSFVQRSGNSPLPGLIGAAGLLTLAVVGSAMKDQ